MTDADPTTRPGPGRPADPGLADRVHKTACRVYGRHGWRGFSIEAIAREAAVGKASIYARWDSKEALLTESLAAQLAFPGDLDTGDLRGDLVILADALHGFYIGEHGDAALRVLAEARLNPELAEHFEAFRDESIRAARKVVKRAIGRGELPPTTDVSSLLVALFGGVVMHVFSTTGTQVQSDHGTPDRQVERLVDLVLRSARP